MIQSRSYLARIPVAAGILFLSACASQPSRGSVNANIIDWQANSAPQGEAQAQLPYGKSYGETSVRLSAFIDELTIWKLDYDYQFGGSVSVGNTERDRVGFRAVFGSGGIGGYFQLFSEEVRQQFLFEPIDAFGIGGGLHGRPVAGDFDWMQITIPYKYGISLVAAVEDENLVYIDTDLELGVGVSIYGFNPSVGAVAQGLSGLHESNVVTGFNVGPYAELLYKHDSFPLYASIRAQAGDVESTVLNVGFAF
jgi:hypothetical protein